MTTSEEELEKQIRKSIGMRERDQHDALIDFVGSKILKGKLKELSDKSRELFVEDLLLILASAQRSAKLEENQIYLDRINNYKPDPSAPSFGRASGAIETAGWKRAFEGRISELKKDGELRKSKDG